MKRVIWLLQLLILLEQCNVIHGNKGGNSKPSISGASKSPGINSSKKKDGIGTSTVSESNQVKEPKTSTTPAIVGTSLIEVYEHEHYDPELKAWIGGSNSARPHRWTSSSTNSEEDYTQLLPPPKLMAPEGYEYSSDWKIDVTGKIRDELGWEYFIDNSASEVGKEIDGEAKAGETTDSDTESEIESESSDMESDSEIVTQEDKTVEISKGRRRRRWLRTVTVIEVPIAPPVTSSRSITEPKLEKPKPVIKKRKRQAPFSSILLTKKLKNLKSDVSDTFNFKGYGWSLSKSLIHANSGGAIWRLPLTAHFDAIEMRPYIPLVTTSIGLHYPPRGTVSINASLPMEFIKCSVVTMVDWVQYLGACVWWLVFQILLWHGLCKLILWNSICAMTSLFGFGATATSSLKTEYVSSSNGDGKRNFLQGRYSSRAFTRLPIGGATTSVIKRYVPPNHPTRRKVVYRGNISDRLGISFTWGLSEEHGAYFRYNWWHLYMPTVDCIGNALETASKKLLKPSQREEMREDSSSSLKTATKNRKNEFRDWLRQKSSALGVMWGGFGCIPEPPYYSCTAFFSLSGFYVGGKIVRQLQIFCRNPLFNGKDGNGAHRISSPSLRGKPHARPLESNLVNSVDEDSTMVTSSSRKRSSRDSDSICTLGESLEREEAFADAKVRA